MNPSFTAKPMVSSGIIKVITPGSGVLMNDKANQMVFFDFLISLAIILYDGVVAWELFSYK